MKLRLDASEENEREREILRAESISFMNDMRNREEPVGTINRIPDCTRRNDRITIVVSITGSTICYPYQYRERGTIQCQSKTWGLQQHEQIIPSFSIISEVVRDDERGSRMSNEWKKKKIAWFSTCDRKKLDPRYFFVIRVVDNGRIFLRISEHVPSSALGCFGVSRSVIALYQVAYRNQLNTRLVDVRT